MALSLRFTFDPPTPYHTLRFHMNRGIKQQLLVQEISRQHLPGIVSELASGLKMLTGFPDEYAVAVLPSRIYAYSILQHVLHAGTLIVPVHPAVSLSSSIILDSGISIKSVIPGEFQAAARELNSEYVVCRDADPGSGFAFKLEDILTLKVHHPEMPVCLDLSSSFMNFALNLENIEAYLFDTGPVTGIDPAITIMVLRKPLYDAIRDTMAGTFTDPFPRIGKDQPQLLLHHEVDILRLFVFKEICYDMVRRDPKIIRNEIIYKSIILYQALEQSNLFNLVVDVAQDRSLNILTAQFESDPEQIRTHLEKKGILYDQFQDGKNGHFARFANFPVHSREQVEFLADTIVSLNKL